MVIDGGTLIVTNAANSAMLDILGGTNILNAGLIAADQLVITNALGTFEFNGGTLITRGAVISNGAPFVIGRSGTTPAVWDVRASASNHLLSVDLQVGNNSSFNQLFLTNGALLLTPRASSMDVSAWISSFGEVASISRVQTCRPSRSTVTSFASSKTSFRR